MVLVWPSEPPLGLLTAAIFADKVLQQESLIWSWGVSFLSVPGRVLAYSLALAFVSQEPSLACLITSNW